MAKIEDLVKRIPDGRLREEIAAEVRELKKHKQFGLAFEEHARGAAAAEGAHPRGNLVVHREVAGNDLWRVVGLSGKKARGGPDKPWHVLINADNYHAPQLLLSGYERKALTGALGYTVYHNHRRAKRRSL